MYKQTSGPMIIQSWYWIKHHWIIKECLTCLHAFTEVIDIEWNIRETNDVVIVLNEKSRYPQVFCTPNEFNDIEFIHEGKQWCIDDTEWNIKGNNN